MKTTIIIALLVFLNTAVIVKGQEIPVPSIWLKADGTGQYSSHWQDVSGNNRHAMFSTGSAHLVFGPQINFNPTISFRELADSMFIEDFSVSDKLYLKAFVVFRNDSGNHEKYIWGTANAAYHKLLVSNWSIYDEFNCFSYDFGKSLQPVMAGVSKYWEKMNPGETSHLFLGGSADKVFNGEIAEFLVFERELDEEESQIVGSYLAIKYGIGMLQTSYRNSGNEIIWDVDENEGYGFAVFGIGRDNGYSLNQKQAVNTYGILSVSTGDFYPSNKENPYLMDNKTFILFSNNGADPEEYESCYQDQNVSYLFNACRWKATVSGTNSRNVSTTLKVNRKDLFADTLSEIFLIIDNNGNDNYTDIQAIAPDSIAENGDLFFNNLQWGNHDQADYFTFAIRSALTAEVNNFPPVCEGALGMITCTVSGGEMPYHIKLTNLGDGQEFEYQYSQNYMVINDLPVGVYSVDIHDAKNNRFLFETKEAIYNPYLSTNIEALYYIEDQPLQLLVDSIKGYTISSYKWYAGEELISESSSITIDNEGNYSLQLGIGQTCEYLKEFYVADLRGTGGDDDDDEDDDDNNGDVTGNEVADKEGDKIKLFPNPTKNGQFYLDFEYQQSTDFTIVITTLSGGIVKKKELKNRSTTNYNDTIEKPGVYIISIWTEGQQVFIEKLVVE